MLERRAQIAAELPEETVRKIRKLVSDPKRPMTISRVAAHFNLSGPLVHMLCTPNREANAVDHLVVKASSHPLVDHHDDTSANSAPDTSHGPKQFCHSQEQYKSRPSAGAEFAA
jgi:hypothetical protein